MFKLWRKVSPEEEENHDQPGYRIDSGLISDVGCHRDSNEDSGIYVRPEDLDVLKQKGHLMIVADGMGGHSAGEIASRLAVEVVSQYYFENPGDIQLLLLRAFREANREIHQAAKRDESLQGMGTTCTAIALRNGYAVSAHVGDSRIYLIRDNRIYLMSEDHSAVGEMVKQGILSAEGARNHPDKNVILRAMGSHADVEVATWQEPFPLREGDRFVLCTDGLYDLVSDEEIRGIASSRAPQPACEQLVALARERGGHDNITVGIVSVGTSMPAIPETRQLEVKA